MKKYFIYTVIALLVIFSMVVNAQDMQEDSITAHVFYGEGCAHCDMLLSFMDELEERYPSMGVLKYEVYFSDENRELFEALANSQGIEIEGVPMLFINDKVFVGYDNSIGKSIEEEVVNCQANGCKDPLATIKDDGTYAPIILTVPVVLSAAAVDAINPCAFAVLIILLTTILAAGIKRKALFAGLAFTASIYISYFLMGLGLYSAIAMTGIAHTFYWIISFAAILVGLFNLKDYFFYGKWFIMEVPLRWRPKLKALLNGVTSVPGAFLIGFVVSLFLLPCTSGPYIVILGLLAKVASRDYAIMLLLLYNLIFILPMIGITLAVYFGLTTTEKTEKWRSSKLKVLHLIAGIIMLLLGIGMIAALKLGLI